MSGFARFSALICLIAAVTQLPGQEKTAPKNTLAEKPKLDALKIPPGTVIIVTPNPRDANPQVDAVVLSPDEYQKLLGSVEQLKKSSTSDRPNVPSVCRLEIERDPESDLFRVHAHFQFRTEAGRTVVDLGLRNCRPVKAQLADSQLPALVPSPNGGFQIVVDSAGEHRLSIDAIVPQSNSVGSSDRSLELSLPGSAITVLEKLQLSADALRLRVNGQPVSSRIHSGTAIVLGPVTQLRAVWDLAPTMRPGESLFTVDETIELKLEDRMLVTNGHLHVKTLRGMIGEFHLSAPATAKVAVVGSKSASVEPPTESRRTQWTIRRPPSAEDLTLEIQVQQPSTRRPLVVHGFPVINAIQQRGTLSLVSPETHRISLVPRVDLPRREEESAVGPRRIAYDLNMMPAQGILADIELQPMRGELEVSYTHTVHLAESNWRLATKLDLRPIRRELDRFDLEIPAELHDFRLMPADLAEVSGPAKILSNGGRIIPLRLTDPTKKPITLNLEGTFSIPTGVSAVSLMLPRMPSGLDRGGSVIVNAPPGMDVRGEVREWDRERIADWDEILTPGPDGSLSLTLDRAPARVDLTWRPTGGEKPMQLITDVEFRGQQGHVRQVIRCPASPRQIHLHGPTVLNGRVNLIEGGTLAVIGPSEWVVRPNANVGQETVVTIEYTFPFEQLDPMNVPLVWPTGAMACESEVRVWALSGPTGPRLPMLDGGLWAETALPRVEDRPRLPALALRAIGVDLPLKLRFSEIGPNLPAAVMDRVWIRAKVDEDGAVAIRTRFLVRALREEKLAFRLPGPPTLLRPSVRLDGRAVDVELHNQLLVVPIADANRAEHVLDIACSLPSRPGWSVRLESPRPVGPIIYGAIRWQIQSPEDRVPLETSGVLWPIVTWNWKRGLWSPAPGLSDAAMLRWFAGDVSTITTEPFDSTLIATSAGLDSLSISTRLDSLSITFLPRLLLNLAASLLALAIGGGLLMIRWTPYRLVVLMAWVMVACVLGWTWPQVAQELLASAQPGIAVLVPAALVGAWIRRRADQRAVFAPLRLAPPHEQDRELIALERTAV